MRALEQFHIHCALVGQEKVLEIRRNCALGARERVPDSCNHCASAVLEKVLEFHIPLEFVVVEHSRYYRGRSWVVGKVLEILLVLVPPSPLVFLPPSFEPLPSSRPQYLVVHRIGRASEHSLASVWQQSGY